MNPKGVANVAIPEQIETPDLADYLDVMSRAIFQAGMSWALVESKWDGFRRVFHGFDPARVAAFGPADVAWLAQEPEIVRSRKKIEGTIENARTLLALDREHSGFHNYLHAFDSYEGLCRDLRKRFKFLGELSVYYFLFRVREPVPPFDAWVATIPGYHPRMREMVEAARAKGTSTETSQET
jgi:hypothetical protein